MLMQVITVYENLELAKTRPRPHKFIIGRRLHSFEQVRVCVTHQRQCIYI